MNTIKDINKNTDKNINKNTKIKKAVFPIAGLGTRFQPFSYGGGKEFVPIVSDSLPKPIIHVAMEEAAEAGAEQFIFVTSPNRKRNLEQYLNPSEELLDALQRKNAAPELEAFRFLQQAETVILEQPKPMGLGDAVLTSKAAIGNEPFFVLLADDVLLPPILPAMAQQYQNGIMIAVEQTKNISAYGAVSPKQATDTPTFAFNGIVEKPSPSEAPSDFGIVGRYIFSPAIFAALEEIGTNERAQMTDAINLVEKSEPAIAFKLANSKRFDCGNPKGWLKLLRQQ